MKHSLKKEYINLFEDTNIKNLPYNVSIDNRKFNMQSPELVTGIETDFPELETDNVVDKNYFVNLSSIINRFLNSSNTITLKIDDSNNPEVNLTNRQIFEIYFILLKENIIDSTSTDVKNILESSQLVTPDDVAQRLFDISSDSGGGENLLRNIIESENSQKFILNIFVFLYRKLIAKKSLSPKPDDESMEYVESNIENYLIKLVRIFKDKIIRKQSGLSTTFGTTFEVIALNRIQDHLSSPEGVDKLYGINKSLLKTKNVEIASKKATVLILLIMQNKFNSSNEFYIKLTGGIQNLSEDFWIDCFANVFEEINVTQLTNLDSIIDKYSAFLGHSNSEVECLDYEEDSLLIKGSKIDDDNKISIPTKNAYFDFIIRSKQENKISNSEINFGLFDLKCTNAKVRSSNQPINKGSTGNNKNNRAIENIKNTILSLDNMTTESSTLHFISLVQITYELVISNNNIDIELKNVSHIYNTPNQVIRNNIDNDKLDIRNISADTNQHINPDQDTINRGVMTTIIYENEHSDIKFNKYVSEFHRIFDLLGILRESGYNGSFENNINYRNYIDILKNCFNYIEEFYKIKEHTSTITEVIRQEIEIGDPEYDPDFYTVIDQIANDTSYNLEKIILDCIAFLTFDKENYIKSIYNAAPSGSQKQRVKRNIALYVLSVFGASKNENYSTYEKASNVFGTLLRPATNPNDFQFGKLNPSINESSLESIAQPIINKVLEIKSKAQDDIHDLIISYENTASTRLAFSKEDLPFIESNFLTKNKILKEVYFHLFKKKVISEGGLAGHMMHPYEALDMTPRQIIDRIKEYSTSQKIIEKVDGQNLFFTVEQDGTLMFARNKADMTHNDLVKKFTNHPAEVPFISGGNAIKEGVDQWLASAGAFGSQEILDIFHPDGEAKSFINFEIMHKDHPNQLEYGENFIVFHSIVDFVNGREAVYSSNSSQRLQRIISLMKPGIESSGYTLASNRTVDLNSLTNVQILSYIERIKEIANMLDITQNEFIGDGVEKQIKNQLDIEGINISDKAIKILYDFALYGKDRLGNKIKSKDFTSLMDSDDVKKLRSIDLTNASKASAKVRSILSPFKEVFVDLGIDLLAGVSSSYMDSKTNLSNINRLREKLKTAIIDLHTYMKKTPESNWEAEVHRLKEHYDKVIEVGIDNAVSTSVEGGVYDFHGDLLKVTGGFAPLNQILGAAYRDKKGIFTIFKEKFVQQESNKRSLKSVFNLIY